MLNGPEQLEWIEALFSTFSEQEFSDLLIYRLDDDLRNYAASLRPPKTAIADVVGAYSRHGREGHLIAKAIEARPGSAALLRLAQRQKAAAAPEDSDLERLIHDTSSFLDISAWLDKAGRLQVCVCRIEISSQVGEQVFGTGFLVAPDLIMTNFHVMEPVIALEDGDMSYVGPQATASDVICRFDYKVLASGAISAGSTFGLARDWRVALSPNSLDTSQPTLDELDFALLRLAQPVGTLPIGNNSAAPGAQRGWISLLQKEPLHMFVPHSPIFIIQHPKGEPLKLALDTNAVQSIEKNRTRVRYSTNTEPGSSGSPCFDQNWNLIALHHAGDPQFAPRYNEGIPIDAILTYLAKHGFTASEGGS